MTGLTPTYEKTIERVISWDLQLGSFRSNATHRAPSGRETREGAGLGRENIEKKGHL